LKRLLIFIPLFSLFFSAKAQKIELIEAKLHHYFEATQTKDWETVMDMANPKIFNFASKESMVQLYSQMESDSGMGMDFSDMEILGIKKEYLLSDTLYVPVDYKMTLEIQLNPDRYQDPQVLNSMRAGFEIAYAGQEMSYDEENMRFIIKVRNTLIASSRKDSDEWYFGEYRPSDPVTKLIFPTEILNKLQTGWN
jgi:hypothetical protein